MFWIVGAIHFFSLFLHFQDAVLARRSREDELPPVSVGVSAKLHGGGGGGGFQVPLRLKNITACLSHTFFFSLCHVLSLCVYLYFLSFVSSPHNHALLLFTASLFPLSLQVADRGVGMTQGQQESAMRFFYTTVVPDEPTYTYSGNFGGQISVTRKNRKLGNEKKLRRKGYLPPKTNAAHRQTLSFLFFFSFFPFLFFPPS